LGIKADRLPVNPPVSDLKMGLEEMVRGPVGAEGTMVIADPLPMAAMEEEGNPAGDPAASAVRSAGAGEAGDLDAAALVAMDLAVPGAGEEIRRSRSLRFRR
jgi:hypothetical protein